MVRSFSENKEDLRKELERPCGEVYVVRRRRSRSRGRGSHGTPKKGSNILPKDPKTQTRPGEGCVCDRHTVTHSHTQSHTVTHRDTQRHTETHRDTQRHTETHRDTQRHTETPEQTRPDETR